MVDQKKIFSMSKYLIFVYMLIVFGYIYSLGFYFIPGLLIIIISLAFLLIFQTKIIRKFESNDRLDFLPFVLIVFVSLSFAFYGGIYQKENFDLIFASKILLAIAIFISLLYTVNLSYFLETIYKVRFFSLLAIAFFIKVSVLITSPTPYVDVFTIQKIAPVALLKGFNPYSIVYPKLYPDEEHDVYSYGPGVILLDLPSVLLTGDPRFTMVFAEFGTALLLFLMLKKLGPSLLSTTRVHEIIPLVYLFNPRSLFILEQAWVDPLIIFLITLFFYLLFSHKRKFISFLVLGVAIATKQYAVFLIPFLLKGKILKLRDLIVVGCAFFMLTGPFLFWNAKDFIRDTVLFNTFIQGSRYDSLSLNSLFYELSGKDIPVYIVVLIEFLVLIYLFMHQKEKNLSSALIATSTLALTTFAIYRLSFIHYYYFAGSLLFLGIVFSLVEDKSLSTKTILEKAG